MFTYLSILYFQVFYFLGKDGRRQMTKIRLNKILKILGMGTISTRKHEWNSGSMVPISITKYKMELWYFWD